MGEGAGGVADVSEPRGVNDGSPGEDPRGEFVSGEHGDALPDDLDVTAYVGPYTFPDIRRRIIPAVIYAVLGIGCLVGWLVQGNVGFAFAGGLLLVVAAYHVATAWHLRVDQTEALVIANRAVGFPVGHASGQLAWRGLLSRPVWRILVYSAESPPQTRGLVELDGVDGEVLGTYTEPNPEDWSDLEEPPGA